MILKLALLVLAVYRLAWLTSMDIGPFGVFDRIRMLFINRIKDEERDYWILEGIHCPMCHSVWYAAAAALVMRPESLEWFFLYWLGIAGAVLFLLMLREGAK